MASGRLAGAYHIDVIAPDGTTHEVFSADSGWFNVAGLGSPDGVQSTTATPEKQNYLGLSKWIGGSGYMIQVSVTASTTDGFDISDCVGSIPVVVNGNRQTIGIPSGNGLNNSNFVAELESDGTATAGVKTPVFRVRAKEGVTFQVGDGKCFMSIENDTA